jgi:hypothetical protein
MRDISFQKPEYLLGSKFSLSRSLLRHERVPHPSRRNLRERLNVSKPPRREAAKYGATASGTGLKGGRRDEKIWRRTIWVWRPCNSLKSHKTTEAFFGKAWRETRCFWKGLAKSLEGRLDSAGFIAASAPMMRAGNLRSEFTSETHIFGV